MHHNFYSCSNPWLLNLRVRLFSVTVRTTFSGLQLTAETSSAIKALIGDAAGVGEEEDAGAEGLLDEAPLPQVPEADKAAVAKVVEEGFIVRKVAKGSNLVDVDYVSAHAVTPDMINDLASFGPNILRLNLRRAGVTDQEVKTIAGFSNLRRLRLEENAITDTAAADIAGPRLPAEVA